MNLPFIFAVDYDNNNFPKEIIFNSVVIPLIFDETNNNNLWYNCQFVYTKNRVDKYLIKIFINSDNPELSYSKVYPIQRFGGMIYCPLDLSDSQIDIGLLVFKEQVLVEEQNICLAPIPNIPFF